MALKLKGSTSGFVAIDAPSVAGNNTLILHENTGSAHQILANDITAGVTTFTQITVSRNGDLTVPGTISIGGTLTYEDVTSVDSVGVVTARGLSIFGNTTGLQVASGISTFQAISLSGNTTGLNVSGIGTFTDSTGNVRIDLHSTGSGTGSQIKLHNDHATAYVGQAGDTTGDFLIYNESNTNIRFFTNGNNERVRIDSSGNLAQGTATPTTPDSSNADNSNNGLVFTMYGDSPAINLIHNTTGGSAASDDYSAINFGRNGSSSNPYRAVIGYKQDGDALHINAQGSIKFDVGGNIASGEVMRITNGKVLIGTTTEGHADSDELTISGTRCGMTIRSANDDYGNIFFSDTTSGTGEYAGAVQYYHSSNQLNFKTNSIDRVSIASDGKTFITRTHSSSDTGNHPCLDLDTYSNDGSPQAAMATGIDFNVEGVHKKRLAVTYADSSAGTGDWIFYRDQGNNVGLRISAAGYVTKPANAYFRATSSTSQNVTSGSGTVINYASEVTDTGGNYDASNSTYTAPVAGVYMFTFNYFAIPTDKFARAMLQKSTNGGSSYSMIHRGDRVSSTANYNACTNVAIISLNAADKVRVVYEEGELHVNTNYNYFQGYLVG